MFASLLLLYYFTEIYYIHTAFYKEDSKKGLILIFIINCPSDFVCKYNWYILIHLNSSLIILVDHCFHIK